ncbi:MAG: hypothetical protein DMF61_14840 [Blastocatellia bacterium AA13]|nr:MAG: hypothetical protein DMF61_14840 [Blastocatellia bacterium AA13]
MSTTRRIFTREFKVEPIKQLDSGKPTGHVARRLEVNPNTLHRWRRELKKHPTTAFSGQGSRWQEPCSTWCWCVLTFCLTTGGSPQFATILRLVIRNKG